MLSTLTDIFCDFVILCSRCDDLPATRHPFLSLFPLLILLQIKFNNFFFKRIKFEGDFGSFSSRNSGIWDRLVRQDSSLRVFKQATFGTFSADNDSTQ